MSRAVFDVGDEGLRFVEFFENGPGDAKIGALKFGSNVINTIGKAFFKGGDESFGAVLDVDPITDLATGSIDGEWLITEGVMDESRDEFLGVLAWSVIIGASGDDDILAVGCMRGLHEEIGAGLAGGVGGRRLDAGEFIRLVREGNRSVDFIRGALKERGVE